MRRDISALRSRLEKVIREEDLTDKDLMERFGVSRHFVVEARLRLGKPPGKGELGGAVIICHPNKRRPRAIETATTDGAPR